jgi:hypothetical protein
VTFAVSSTVEINQASRKPPHATVRVTAKTSKLEITRQFQFTAPTVDMARTEADRQMQGWARSVVSGEVLASFPDHQIKIEDDGTGTVRSNVTFKGRFDGLGPIEVPVDGAHTVNAALAEATNVLREFFQEMHGHYSPDETTRAR